MELSPYVIDDRESQERWWEYIELLDELGHDTILNLVETPTEPDRCPTCGWTYGEACRCEIEWMEAQE